MDRPFGLDPALAAAHLRSARDLVTTSGQQTNHRSFDSFGRLGSQTNAALDTLFAYTGRPLDRLTGLEDHQARWYDPATGRFLTEDPLGFAAGDDNLYSYVANGSLNATDRDGRQKGGGSKSVNPGSLSSSTLNGLAAGLLGSQIPLGFGGAFNAFDFAVGAGLPSAGKTVGLGPSGGSAGPALSTQQLVCQQWSSALINAGNSLANHYLSNVNVDRSTSVVDYMRSLSWGKSELESQAADVSNAYWGTLGSQLWYRGTGLAGAVGGTALTVAGLVEAGAASTTVVGAGLSVVGLAAALKGFDTAQAGFRQFGTGEPVNSATYQAVLSATGSPVAASAVDLGTDVALGYGVYKIASARHVSVPQSTGPRLVHMTKAGDAIRSSGRLGLPSDLYAGPASNANLSGWALTGRTGLSPGGNFKPVFIPEAAEAAFSKPIPIGPVTAWQRLTGQQYAARGVIDLSTGEFTRAGINRTQALWYTFDVGVTGTAIGGAYWYATGGDE